MFIWSKIPYFCFFFTENALAHIPSDTRMSWTIICDFRKFSKKLYVFDLWKDTEDDTRSGLVQNTKTIQTAGYDFKFYVQTKNKFVVMRTFSTSTLCLFVQKRKRFAIFFLPFFGYLRHSIDEDSRQ